MPISKINFVVFIALSLLEPNTIFARENSIEHRKAELINCYDGDTCTFRVSSKKMKVRFFGIDAPEKKQTFGIESRNELTALLKKAKAINLKCNGKESYDRPVCEVFADEVNANEYQVKSGFAWDSPHFSKGKFKEVESKARNNKLGLWKLNNPQKPECFRKPHRNGC